jgi:hypothetical protein
MTYQSNADFARRHSPAHIACGERMDDLQRNLAAEKEAHEVTLQVMHNAIHERDAAQARVGELEQQYLDMASLSIKHEHLADAARAEVATLEAQAVKLFELLDAARAEASALREALGNLVQATQDPDYCTLCRRNTAKRPGHQSWCWARKSLELLAAATQEPAPDAREAVVAAAKEWKAGGYAPFLYSATEQKLADAVDTLEAAAAAPIDAPQFGPRSEIDGLCSCPDTNTEHTKPCPYAEQPAPPS